MQIGLAQICRILTTQMDMLRYFFAIAAAAFSLFAFASFLRSIVISATVRNQWDAWNMEQQT